MTTRRLLLVKTSSMGDVVHAFGAVSEAAAQGWTVDWVVEEAFVPLVAMHPHVDKIITIAWRRWRKRPLRARQEMAAFFANLRERAYDCVVDSQGLLKSAIVAVLARGPACGFDVESVREKPAALLYASRFSVGRQHAVLRQRLLLGAALNYTPGTAHPRLDRTRADRTRDVLLLHGTTWVSKHWPEAMWLALANMFSRAGYNVLVTGGDDRERARAERIAVDGSVLPIMDLGELAAVISRCALVVGVDSGLTHLSAALDVPTIGLYGPTDASLTGPVGAHAVSLSSGLACAPCLRKLCAYRGAPQVWGEREVEPACFAELSPERVWSQAQQLLAVRG
ncbi:MAG: lipopolysaccharide heptosyltransferase I [Pseudomonadota bacterium]